MNVFHPTPKTIQTEWDEVIALGSKLQRKTVRFFVPHFVTRGLRPRQVTCDVLSEILETLPEDAARLYFKIPAQKNRYAVNSLVRALVAIEDAHHLGLPRLKEFPHDDATEQSVKKAWEVQFDRELSAFFATYRLPNTLIVEREDGSAAPNDRARADVGEPIKGRNRDNMVLGIYTAHNYAVASGNTPPALSALHATPCLQAILAGANRDPLHGAAILALRSLAALAHHNSDIDAWRILNAKATEILDLNDGNTVSPKLLRRLEQFRDLDRFHQFGRELLTRARIESYRDIATLRGLTRTTAAIAALTMILAPTTVEIIDGSGFCGTEYNARPELWSEKYGSVEQPLHAKHRALLTDFYVAFRRAYGLAPTGLLVGKDGRPRNGGASSINKLLKRIQRELAERYENEKTPESERLVLDFSASELRDLGIFRMAWGGDDEQTMARAARVSEKHLREHFRPMFDRIRSQRKKPNGQR